MLIKKVFAAVLIAAVLAMPASAMGDVSAKAAVLLDAESGRVLYCKNEDQMLPIASTTKIMTALVVLESCKLTEKVKIPDQAVGVEGSSLYLQKGEILTVEDLLYGLLLRSGNDAAVALAIHCAGSVEEFAELMNKKADELGLNHCHFVNPNGLDEDGHLCSALDLAKIAAAAMDEPDFARIVASKSYSFGTRTVVNHNKLLWLYDGAVGVKTGFTKKAGRTLVGAAKRDGQLLITVTLGDPDDWNDHMAMLDYGFKQYPRQTLVKQGEVFEGIQVLSGQYGMVSVEAAESVAYPLAENEEYEVKLMLPSFIFAPVKAGSVLGKAMVYVDGVFAGEADLAASNDVPELIREKSSIIDRIFRKHE